MPAASKKGLPGGAVAADGPRLVVDEDEVDDEDDELIDDEDDEDSLADGVDVAPAPSTTTNPTHPTSTAATLDHHHHHHHHPIPVAVAVAVTVDEEEDLPSSSSSSSAEEDNDAPPDLRPPAAAPPSAAAANKNPNPNPSPSPSSSTAVVALPTPLNGSSRSLDLGMIPASASNHTPSPKRLRTSSDDPKPTPTPPPSDDSRRLFQRLWTDDDEIELLQGFLEFTSQRSALSNHHHHDTTPFYDQIKTRLQVDFNKNQLVEKLRRLKKKYRNALNRISSSKDFAFKSPHEQATFEISRKIWSTAAADTTFDDNDDAGNHPLLHNGGGTAFQFDRGSSRSSSRNKRSRARSTNSVDGLPTASLGGDRDHPPPAVVVAGYLPPPPPPPQPQHHPVLAPPTSSSTITSLPSLIEDTVRSCLSPLFKELLHCAVTNSASSGFAGVGMPLNPLLPQVSSWSLGGVVGGGNSEGVDDRWRKQQILELEVYSKRLELVQEQIKLALEDLKSKGG